MSQCYSKMVECPEVSCDKCTMTPTPFQKFKNINHKHAYMLLEWNDNLPVKFSLHELTKQNLYALLSMTGINKNNN